MYYDKPAEVFEEAIPLGNGNLGAMIYGGTQRERISLNEDTVWSGTNKKNPAPETAPEAFKKAAELVRNHKYYEAQETIETKVNAKRTQIYMPAGNVYIDFGHEAEENYRRELDLKDAIARVSYVCDGVKYQREYLASFPNKCIAVKLTADKKNSLNFRIHTDTKHKVLKKYSEDDILVTECVCPSDGRIKSEEVYKYSEEGIRFCEFINVKA